MDKIFRKLLFVAAIALLSLAPSAFADSDVSVSIDGSYPFASFGYGVPPYGGMLNGQPAEFYCVDFTHDIAGGDSWLAIVTPVASSGTSTVPYLAGQTTDGVSDYLLFAWLIDQMQGASQSTQAQDQWAIWSLTDGGYDPDGDPSSILSNAAAQLTAADFTGQGWEILTPDSSVPNNFPGQEFMIQTPEPSSVLLLGMGLCGLLLLKRREKLLS
jgi:hypothetical protein